MGGILIEVKVKEMHQHSDFNSVTMDYDYLLLRLAINIIFDETKRAIPVAGKYDIIEDGTLCVVTGCGFTQSESWEFLRKVMSYVKNKNMIDSVGSPITSRMVCAGYENGGKDGYLM